jgi:hypothetical protein
LFCKQAVKIVLPEPMFPATAICLVVFFGGIVICI